MRREFSVVSFQCSGGTASRRDSNVLFDILVVEIADCRFGAGESRSKGFEKYLIKDGSFGESKSTKKRVMNQDLRRGSWVELGLP